jgi:hypothetical protein
MHLLSAIGAKLRVAGLASLPLGSRFAGTLLFQRPSEERLDYGLATDIGPGRTFVKFPQHALGQIDVHATDGPPPNPRRRLPPKYHSMKYRPSAKAAQLGWPVSFAVIYQILSAPKRERLPSERLPN